MELVYNLLGKVRIQKHILQFLEIGDFVVSDPSACRFLFPGGSVSKESACNVGDQGSTPGLESSPEEGNGKPLQYSCLENSMDRGAWRATVYGEAKSWTQLNN